MKYFLTCKCVLSPAHRPVLESHSSYPVTSACKSRAFHDSIMSFIGLVNESTETNSGVMSVFQTAA
jgi:hypothetical protein